MSSQVPHVNCGTGSARAKLTDKQVLAIRAARAKVHCRKLPPGHPLSVYSLAAKYGVCIATISRIVHRTRWTHI